VEWRRRIGIVAGVRERTTTAGAAGEDVDGLLSSILYVSVVGADSLPELRVKYLGCWADGSGLFAGLEAALASVRSIRWLSVASRCGYWLLAAWRPARLGFPVRLDGGRKVEDV